MNSDDKGDGTDNINNNMTSTWLGNEKPLDLKRGEAEVLSIGISVGKKERTVLKTSDKKTYYKVRDTCTKGIDSKFTQLKAIDENSPIVILNQYILW